MSGDQPARRTSSGHTLRLVGGTGAEGADDAATLGEVPSGVAGDLTEADLALPVERRSVAVGRHWVVRLAADAGVTGMANQVVELLSSELLANAVLHGGDDRTIGLSFRADDDTVRVSVSDGATTAPVVLHPEPLTLSGRGMAIVEAMSDRWGVEADETGKTVWFELDLAEY